MSYTTLPLQDHISEQSTIDITYSTLSAQFGDGYEQTAANGINNKQKNWQVTYYALDETKFNQVMTFVDSVGGHLPFYATPRGEVQQTWRVVPNSVKVSHVAVSNIDGKVWRGLQMTLKRAYV